MNNLIQRAFSSILFVFILTACAAQTTCPPPVTPSPTATLSPTQTKIVSTETVPAVEVMEIKPVKEERPLEEPFPNLWTKINKDKIAIYPYNFLTDYVVAEDGSVWMTGGFGVIHQDSEGQQTWYSIKNGLTNNFFNVVAISPDGEIWIGGNNNALFRYDGNQWIDEGEKLPSPYDTRDYPWLCNSRDIHGIDFGPDGSAWAMNGGIEIYRQAYGQWINIPFPKNILPFAGGGACPEGIRVKTENDITIKIGRC